jgi:hypothetical protein
MTLFQKLILFVLILINTIRFSNVYGQFDTATFIQNQKAQIINDLKETKINGIAIAFFNKDSI